MTRFAYFLCDECGKQLENVECSSKQLMYTLIANYDADNYKAHFCGRDCLIKYIDKKVFEHKSLPNIEDGPRSPEWVTRGQMEEDQEK